jgi:hypothetical protein
MSKNSIYVMDVISYYVLSVLAVFFTYNDLVFVESVENEYNVYSVFSLNPTGEKIGFFLMFIASAFLLYFIYRVNKEIRNNSLFAFIGKEVLLLFIILFLLFSYAVMPFIFMISVSTQQVIPTSRFTEILKYIILLLPLVFYAISFIITVILKIKGTKFDE